MDLFPNGMDSHATSFYPAENNRIRSHDVNIIKLPFLKTNYVKKRQKLAAILNNCKYYNNIHLMVCGYIDYKAITLLHNMLIIFTQKLSHAPLH